MLFYLDERNQGCQITFLNWKKNPFSSACSLLVNPFLLESFIFLNSWNKSVVPWERGKSLMIKDATWRFLTSLFRSVASFHSRKRAIRPNDRIEITKFRAFCVLATLSVTKKWGDKKYFLEKFNFFQVVCLFQY